MTLTSADREALLDRMQQGGHRIQLNEQTRHLIIQKLLIDYIYNDRGRQIEAIVVRNIAEYSRVSLALAENAF